MMIERVNIGRKKGILVIGIGGMIFLSVLTRSASLIGSVESNIGSLYLSHGNSQASLVKAEQWLNRSLSQTPTLTTYWLLGMVYWQEGHIDKAVATWRTKGLMAEAIEIALQQIDKNPAYRQQWERQLAALPLSSKNLTRLGDIYRKSGDYSKAIMIYQKTLTQIKQDSIAGKADIYYKLGNLYQFYLDDQDNALAAYEDAVASSDFKDEWNHGDTYIQIASLLLSHDNSGALRAAQHAVAIMPTNVLAHTVLGLAIFSARGDLHAAEQEMSIAAKLDPTSVWPWMHRGQLYFQAQQYEQAVAAYQHVLELQPNTPIAADMIKFIQATHLVHLAKP